MSLHVVVRLTTVLVIGTLSVALADDKPPPASYEQPMRIVSFPQTPHAPVRINYGYVALYNGPHGEHDVVNTSCLRFSNTAEDSIAAIRFKRTYFDATGRRLGDDTVDDSTTHRPDRHPTTASGARTVADQNWKCWRMTNRFGPHVRTVEIVPAQVKLASGKVWRPSSMVAK